MKVLVVMPAYNEAGHIYNLIKEVKNYHFEILVIDDGSSDDTYNIAKGLEVNVMLNLRNQGKGASLIKGFKYALENDFEAVITMDADGQHQPQDLPLFLKAAEDKDVHIVIGNRMTEVKRMPLIRVATNKFMSWFISFMGRQRIPDTQCGLRLIKRKVLERIELKTSKFETESEILIKASRMGFKIRSIPIKSIYGEEKSRINPFSDTLRFFRLIYKWKKH
ncbi:MAG: glycosyltransferase family 2 protein [Candidatus Omnitrophota bacterium]